MKAKSTKRKNRIKILNHIHNLWLDFMREDLKHKIIMFACVAFVIISSVWGVWRVSLITGFEDDRYKRVLFDRFLEGLSIQNDSFLTGHEFYSPAERILLCEDGDTQACDFVPKKERDRICAEGRKYACPLSAEKVVELENLCENGNISACKSVLKIYGDKFIYDYSNPNYDKENPYHSPDRYLEYSKKVCDMVDLKNAKYGEVYYCKTAIDELLDKYDFFEALPYVKKYCDSDLDSTYNTDKCAMFLFLAYPFSSDLDVYQNAGEEAIRSEIAEYVKSLCVNGKCQVKNAIQNIEKESQKCDSGDAIACVWLGDKQENTKTATRFYHKACELKHIQSCLNVAEFYKQDETFNSSAYLQYEDKACDLGDIKTCVILESIYKKVGNKVKSSFYQHKISQHYKNVCSLNQLSNSLQDFDEMNDECIWWQTKQRCDSKNAIECIRLGQFYLQKCENYDSGYMQNSCFYEWGEYKEANSWFYFDKACDLGNMLGCEYAGDTIIEEYFLSPHEKKSNQNDKLKYYQKACKGGNLGACDKVEIIKQEDFKKRLKESNDEEKFLQ